ncbi:LytR/AlgR family response regulator transcription factor [Flavobacterium album]|nr:LytTR family DNA-binding domain-containing protein [Flavobacterium album]
MTFKAIIIDEDRHAAHVLKEMLNDIFFEIVIMPFDMEGANLQDPACTLQPDLIFIDCAGSGLEVPAALNRLKLQPEVIFLSSDKMDAAKAYEFNASGFVLKPIEKDALTATVDKALLNIKNRRMVTKNQYKPAVDERSFFIISSVNSYEIIKLKDLLYCVADGRYTEFRLVDGTKLLASKNLSVYDNILSGQRYFFRASRSSIINFEYVKRVNKKDGMQCEFIDGSSVAVAKRKIMEFNQFLQSMDIGFD